MCHADRTFQEYRRLERRMRLFSTMRIARRRIVLASCEWSARIRQEYLTWPTIAGVVLCSSLLALLWLGLAASPRGW